MKRLRCRLFGHWLYAEPTPGEFCDCRCGRSFMWLDGWRPLPTVLRFDVVDADR